MKVSIGKYKLKIWLIVLMSVYHHTIMFSFGRLLSYIYAYAIPLLYIFLHINAAIDELRYIKKGYLPLFGLTLLIALAGAVVSPTINGTFDYSYITDGPFKLIFTQLIINLFLVLVYKRAARNKASLIEYLLYYVFANVLYVLGTLVICAFPKIHEFFIQNCYMDEYTKTVAQFAIYYTRIGWSGYSSIVPSAVCSLSIIYCALHSMSEGKGKRFIITNILFLILLVGCFCYARTGVISSVLCIVLYVLYLLRQGSIKLLSYPVIITLVLVVFTVLLETSPVVKNWYDWGFAQIIAFQRTGSFETDTIRSLLNMYKKVPSGITLLIGDGRYTTDSGYYMSVDVGWFRSIYNYGLIFAIPQYLSVILLIVQLKTKLKKHINKHGRRIIWIMLMCLFLVFESKGEIWYVLIPLLLSACFIQYDELKVV